MTGTKGRPGGNHGTKRGPSSKPAGERKHFYLAPDLREWWDSLPERGRSEIVNRALRLLRNTDNQRDMMNESEDQMEEKMSIKVRFSDAALWGDVDPSKEGYDAQASAGEFANQLESALRTQYPDASIDVEYSGEDYHRVNGQGDTDTAADVGETVNRVWTGWGWMVKAS